MSSRTEKRVGVCVRLKPSMIKCLRDLALSRRVSMTSIIEDALSNLMTDPVEMERKASRVEILRLERKLKTIGMDVTTIGEVVGAYVYNWMCHLTPMPFSERASAAALGKARFEKFLEQVKVRRQSDDSLWGLVDDDPLESDNRGEVEKNNELPKVVGGE